MAEAHETPSQHVDVPVPTGSAPPRQTVDGERLLALFQQLVEPIGKALPATSEVVLHDLSLLPNSIVAVYGDVTGRRVGDPATDLLLKKAASRSFDNSIGYETRLPDGRRLKSSTMIIKDVSGTPVLAFCINSDMSVWQSVSRIAEQMLGAEDVLTSSAEPCAAKPSPAPQPESPARELRPESESVSELFVHDVDELAAALLHQAQGEVRVPVDLMHKKHKLEVVRILKSRGFFMLRDAVEMVATSLHVTRFTIYNYLNELADEASDPYEDPAQPEDLSAQDGLGA